MFQGLNAAGLADEIFCSDSNEYVDAVFDKCVDSLPVEQQDKMYFEPFDAEAAVEEGQCDEATVIIVDQPRKGLDKGVLDLLLGTHPTHAAALLQRLVYVSCGFDALERDAQALVQSGKWRMTAANCFLLFPGSDHIESVVVFDKRNS